MHLLVIVLERVDLLPELVSALKHAGVQGITMLNSMGVGRSSFGDFPPVVAHLGRWLGSQHADNITMFSVVPDEIVLGAAVDAAEVILGPFSVAGSGIMFSIPLGLARGVGG